MTKITINRVGATPTQLDKLYEGSALTMLGYMPDELHLYIEALQPFINGDTVTVYEMTGKDLNRQFDIELPAKLNVFVIDLDNLKDIPKLSVTLRFELGFRWLDDVVDNLQRKKEMAQ